MVVVDALPCLSALYNPGFQSQAEVDCTGIVQQLMAQDDAQFARQQRLSAANLTTDSLLCERLMQWGTSSDRRTYAQMYCDYSNTDMRPMLGRVCLGSAGIFFPTNGSDGGRTIQRTADRTLRIRHPGASFHHAGRLGLVYQAVQRFLG